jgi:predicted metal-dependent hydrolase
MELVEKAYSRLYPGENFDYSVSLDYSRRFKPYNANVRIRGKILEFNFSKEWSKVNDEIVIGLVQSLLLKIFRDNKKTTNIDLYNLFIKKLHLSIPKTKIEPYLEKSFERVNDRYFYGLVEKPNLVWGNETTTKLGCYNYQTDTITISTIFEDADETLLDYVMYHEMLHKKHKFTCSGKRSMHHTAEFRQKEKLFENHDDAETGIKKLVRRTKTRNFRWF